MKIFKLVSVLLSLLIFHSAFSSSRNTTALDSSYKQDLTINYAQFVKYLDNGNPDSLEGVYTTEDNRYVIAIIKNKTKSHDFIGVVISADNSKWNVGEIKFNFVLKNAGQLEGYYYNSANKAFPISMYVGNSRIGDNLLKKIELKDLQVDLLVNL